MYGTICAAPVTCHTAYAMPQTNICGKNNERESKQSKNRGESAEFGTTVKILSLHI